MKKMSKKQKQTLYKAAVTLLAVICVFVWRILDQPPHAVSVDQVPPYSGELYAVIADNVPGFSPQELVTEGYEFYSELDWLGRCGYAMACVGRETMPTEDREGIGHIKPSGWVQAQYDFVEGKSLYNRSHLIGFQLTGENDNEKNLITGTRTCNAYGMLPFENMIADFVKETGYHVMYRVTPIYSGEELVARGIQLEALSVEDGGKGVCFHVYVYNAEPGVSIDYATGSSYALENGGN